MTGEAGTGRLNKSDPACYEWKARPGKSYAIIILL